MNIIHYWGRLFLRFLSPASERVRIVSDDDVSLPAHPRFRREEIACFHAFSCEGGALWKPLDWYLPLSVSPPCCYLLAFVQNLRQKGSFSAADFEHLINLQNKQYFFASSDENFFTRASQVCKIFPLVLVAYCAGLPSCVDIFDESISLR
jgi:hypothetical protein